MAPQRRRQPTWTADYHYRDISLSIDNYPVLARRQEWTAIPNVYFSCSGVRSNAVLGELNMATQPNRSRGQALLLVTFALFAMCGLLGLAVDLGWGYFVKKSAQAGTDAGALAGAYAALSLAGQNGAITCSTSGISCKSDPGAACDQSGNLKNACQYAEQEGFAAADIRVSAG